MTKKRLTLPVIQNRRVRHDYDVRDEFNVGIILNGPEVKAARSGLVSLRGSYITIKDNEVWLINASFSVIHTKPGSHEHTVETGARKLLAKKKEIASLIAAKEQGLTIVPLAMTTRTPYIKLFIATAKGKKLHDKRHAIKQRDQEREARRAAGARISR